ncbi:MAG: hypothetical protein V3T86_10860 [Planctomycetota bacterium]
MRWILTLVALVVVLVPSVTAEEKALQELPLDERLEKAAKWLASRQRGNGTWTRVIPDPARYVSSNKAQRWEPESQKRPPFGVTLFVLYTLLESGYTPKDRVIKNGHKWVLENCQYTQMWHAKSGKDTKDNPNMSTYDISAMLMYLEARYRSTRKKQPLSDNPTKPPKWNKIPKDEWRLLNASVVYLTRGVAPAPRRAGFKGCQNINGLWRYGQRRPKNADSHATHFVLTGLRAAARAGYPVRNEVWLNALKGLRITFRGSSGGYAYERAGAARIQTTAAVVAGLHICHEQLLAAGVEVPKWLPLNLKNGLKVMDDKYYVGRLDLRRAPAVGERGTIRRGLLDPLGARGNVDPIYFTNYLWTIEQLEALTGREQFRGENWHAARRETLLAVQEESGAFDDWTMVEPKQILATCFALHFLKRTTPPPKKPAR